MAKNNFLFVTKDGQTVWGGVEKGKQTKIFASLRRAVVIE